VERYGAGPIVVIDYDPAWPAMFERERANVAAALGPLAVIIEHVGSTAVPGLAAKPIIDLLIGARSLPEARAHGIAALQALGYTYVPEYRSFLPDELFFRKGVGGPWTHHLHVMEPSNPRWEHRLLFRDYLRAHPEAAQDYVTLKRRLAATCKDDIAAYRNGKDAFVADAMAKARREYGASADRNAPPA
jgi:GrpB-like predicted nucleotidyltransferase (UPF0157 family)